MDSVDAHVPAVGEVISRRLLTCAPDVSVAEAAALMRADRCSSIVIIDGKRPVGIWTEHDALRFDFGLPGAFDRPISEVMTRDPKTISSSASVHEAGLRYKRERVRHLVVVENDEAVGMLSQTDVIQNHGVEHYLTFRDVRSVMSAAPPVLSATMSIRDAAECMKAQRVEAAIVAPAADGEEFGIVTERDLVRAVAQRDGDSSISDLATRPVLCVPPGATLLAARAAFSQHRIRHLAVRDKDQFVGLLSFSDILNILQYEYVEQLNGALRERDEALIRSRKDLLLARQVIEASLEAVMIVDERGLIEYVNPAFTTLTGYDADEAVGRSPNILKSGQQDDGFYCMMWKQLLEQGQWQGEIWNRRKDGEIFAEYLSINTIRSDDGRIVKYAAIFSDITERKRREEKVTQLAYFDSLTGLPNRRLLLDRLGVALHKAHRDKHPLAVMFLDLDLFKRINDTLGHDVGDRVLTDTARRLTSCVRECDTVARIGGDEFIILLPELHETHDAEVLAQRIIDSVRQPLEIGSRSLFVTTSVGIALYPADGQEAERLLKLADQAMYASKQVGRNRYHLASETMISAGQSDLLQRLQKAIADNRLSLAYQVKVNLLTGAISGAEALIRWHDPERGSIAPGEFLPLAEKSGLMVELGHWILTEACRQNKAWQAVGLPPVPMSINLSPFQFRDADLADHVLQALDATGLEARYLEIEIHESAILEHPKEVRDVLSKVTEAGVTVSVDDFGSRYSSLGALRQLPIHSLKIDRSLIAGIDQPFAEKDLVGAIVQMARALGMRVVAEGVETAVQADFLRRAGCDEIQGWLISRPVSAQDVESLFRRSLLPPQQA